MRIITFSLYCIGALLGGIFFLYGIIMSGMRHNNGLPPEMKFLSDLSHYWEASGLVIYFMLMIVSTLIIKPMVRRILALSSQVVIWTWLVWVFMTPDESGQSVVFVPVICGIFFTLCGCYTAFSLREGI
jgi:hypothetical protein